VKTILAIACAPRGGLNPVADDYLSARALRSARPALPEHSHTVIVPKILADLRSRGE
jgi:hypothetical protein